MELMEVALALRCGSNIWAALQQNNKALLCSASPVQLKWGCKNEPGWQASQPVAEQAGGGGDSRLRLL